MLYFSYMLLSSLLLCSAAWAGSPFTQLSPDSLRAGQTVLFLGHQNAMANCLEGGGQLVELQQDWLEVGGAKTAYGRYRLDERRLLSYTFTRSSGDSLYLTAAYGEKDDAENYLGLCLRKSDLAKVYGADDRELERRSLERYREDLRERKGMSKGAKVFWGGMAGAAVGTAVGFVYGYSESKTVEESLSHLAIGAAAGFFFGVLIASGAGD